MIPFGSVPVASSQVLTSPTVASPSLILSRTASADDQNTADSGLAAASIPRRRPGSEVSASADGTVSSASATSRLVSPLSGRPARLATRSGSRFTKTSGGCPGLQAGEGIRAPRTGLERIAAGTARLPRFFDHLCDAVKVRMAYRCRAYPDQAQQQVLARTFGCVRVVWNRTLAARRARYAA